MKNKVIVVEGSFPSVSETFILDQITGLIDLGFEVENWAFTKSSVSTLHENILKYHLDEKTKYISLPSSNYHNSSKEWFKEFQRLNPSFSVNDTDVFHVHFGTSFLSLQPLFMEIRNRVVISFHGFDASEIINTYGDRIYSFLFKRADKVTTPSIDMKNRLVEAACSEDKIVVHHYGVNTEAFNKTDYYKKPEIKLLTIARFVEKKGILNSLKAFSKIDNKQNVKYKLIGEGPLHNEILKLVEDLNLRSYVEISSFLSKEKIAEEMSSSDIYILPSITAENGDKEGMPVSIIEAQAAGLPVISTYHAGIPEIVKNGVTGFLLEENDIEGIKNGLEKLIFNYDLRKNMSDAARKNAEADFNIVQLNKNLAEILTEKKNTPTKLSPFISICIPTYNRKKYLAEAIQSALNQTYTNFEIVVVDDGSTEDIEGVVKQFNSSKIKFIKKEHTNAPHTRNRCIEEASGEFILWLDDDDIMHTELLMEYNTALNSYPECDAFYSYFELYYEETKEKQVLKYDDWYFNRSKLAENLLIKTQFMHNGGLYRKTIYSKIGNYNEKFLRAHDYEIAFRIAFEESIKFKLIPKPLYTYRLHNNENLSGTLKGKDFRYDCAILDNALSEKNISKIFPGIENKIPQSASIYFNLALKYLQLQSLPRAIQLFEKSVEINSDNSVMNLLNEVKSKYDLLMQKRNKILAQLKNNPDNSELRSSLLELDKILIPFSVGDLFNEKAIIPEKKDYDTLVSVIIPCYNQANYLEECVESVVDQTYKNWECIIVNDGSPDNTSDVANALIASHGDKKIKLIKIENNGLANARNTGINLAEGNYILPLDSDDMLAEDAIEKMISVFQNDNDIELVYSDYEAFGSFNQYVTTIKEEEFYNSYRNENGLAYCSMYKKELWKRAGGYNKNMIWGYEDWDFWLSCLERKIKKVAKIKKPLMKYRTKANSMISNAIKHNDELRAQMIMNHQALFNKEIIEKAVIVLNKNPLVSVIVPTYNRPQSLKEAVGSVVKQTYKEIEVVVVNDSGEDVEEIINSFKDQRIKYFVHLQNKGLAAARNTGIRNASGKYIALLDDDDIFYTNHVQTAVDELSVGQKVVYTDAVRVSYENNKLVSKEVPYSIDYDPNKLLVGNIAPVNCFVFEKEIAVKAGLFDESLPVLEDWEFWIRLSQLTEFKHIKQVTNQVNWKKDGSTMTSSKQNLFDENRLMIYKKYENEINLIPDLTNIVEEFNAIWKNDSQITKPLVSIIVLTYNGLDYTKQFISSLIKTTNENYELIIIDNASTDGTVDYLKEIEKASEDLKVIYNNENIGFPAGVNQGILSSSGSYILLANNDILFTEGWLERMIEVAESDTSLGIVGPISNAVSGVQFDKDANYSTIEEMHSYAASIKEKNINKIYEFPRVAFLCTLIKKEVIEKIGGLDEIFTPGNFEDDDFCLRAQIAGFKTVVAQDVFIHHFGSKSFTADGVDVYQKRLEVNKKKFIEKWGADPEEIWLQGKPIKERNIMYPINNYFNKIIEKTVLHLNQREYGEAYSAINDVINNYNSSEVSVNEINQAFCLAGNIALIINKPDEARNYFERALNINPKSSEACTGLGEIFFNEQNYDAAKTMFEYAVNYNDSNKAAAAGLKKVNSLLENENDVDNDNLIKDAYKFFKEGFYDKSLKKLLIAEKQFNGHLSEPENSKMAAAFFNLKGYNYLGLEEIEPAKENFEHALNLDPNSSEAWAGLGEYFYLTGNDENARVMFEYSINYNANNIAAIEGLKKLKQVFDETSNDNSIESSSSDIQAKLSEILSSVYELFNLKKYNEALEALNNTEELFYSQLNQETESIIISSFENLKGLILLTLDKKEEARNSFEIALNINPSSSQACAGLGELLFLSGKDNEAKTMYEWAVKNNPQNNLAVKGLEKINSLLGYEKNHNSLSEILI